MHPLIDVTSLATALAGEPAPVVLDVRWRLGGPPGVEAYRQGHLPGAVFVDLDHDLSDNSGNQGRQDKPGGRHPLPKPADFERAMRRHGIRDDRLVVAYDDADATAAARAWWLLRYFGHRRVRVLDGGYRAWVKANKPVSTEEPTVAGGDFVARPGGMPLLDAEGAAELAHAGVLLDARTAERYRGEVEPVDAAAGHVPGAVSAPTLSNVGVDGRFLPSEMLRARFAKLGATDAAEVGAYCGSGVTAAHEILALTLAGVPAALYVGSWSDWISDTARPIVTGGR